MKPISHPNVNVDDHRPRSDCPQRVFAKRDRMLLESPIKSFVKEDAILPQGRLVAGSHGDCRFYETAAAFDLGSGLVGIELKGTARDPGSLLRDLLVRFAADGEAYGAEPNFH